MWSQIIELCSFSGRGPKIALLKFILNILKGLKIIFLQVLECILDALKDTVLILQKVIAASCPIVQWRILLTKMESVSSFLKWNGFKKKRNISCWKCSWTFISSFCNFWTFATLNEVFSICSGLQQSLVDFYVIGNQEVLSKFFFLLLSTLP